MPRVIGARMPKFLQTLMDYGWDAAKKKLGGNVARVSGEYLATLNSAAEMRRWLMILNDIPGAYQEFLMDIYRNYVIAKGVVPDEVTELVHAVLPRLTTMNGRLLMGRYRLRIIF